MELSIINQSNDLECINYEPLFHQISKRAEAVLNIGEDKEMSVIFVNEADIQKINLEYRHIDAVTDVISFALNDLEDDYEKLDGNQEIGDIFICVDRMKEQAKEYHHSEKREMGFLFTHGLLHLLGFDHMNTKMEQEMFHMQDVILNDIVPNESNT
ncbi:MAG: rRNA maturation RNase YbeY [Erysipelotrichaceae bacterium]